MILTDDSIKDVFHNIENYQVIGENVYNRGSSNMNSVNFVDSSDYKKDITGRFLIIEKRFDENCF